MITHDGLDGTPELVRAASGGSSDAVEQMVRQFGPELVSFAQSRGSMDPESLVGDAFLKVFSQGDSIHFSDKRSLRAYLFTTIRNLIIDEHRRRSAGPRFDELRTDELDPAMSFENRLADEAWVAHLLDELTPAQREVIELRFFSDLSVEQTAERLAKPPGTIKALQHRAVKKLRILAIASLLLLVLLAVLYSVLSREPMDLQPIQTDPSVLETEVTVLGSADDERLSSSPTQAIRSDGGIEPEPNRRRSIVGSATTSASRDRSTTIGPPLPAATATTSASTSTPFTLVRAKSPSTTDPTVDISDPEDPSAATTTTSGTPISGTPTSGTSTTASTTTSSVTSTTIQPTSEPPGFPTEGGLDQMTPGCASIGGPTSIAEGSTASYRVVLDQAPAIDVRFEVDVVSGTARRVGAAAGADAQDIMWGGYYTIGTFDPDGYFIVTDTVHGRVPNGSGPADGDRPMVGPPDASWDFTVYRAGVAQEAERLTVTVKAGRSRSEPIEVTAWLEWVTVDDLGGDTGGNFNEGTETLTIATGDGSCSLAVTIADGTRTELLSQR